MSHLHDLVLESGQEEVDDLVLLDGERVEVDLLHGLDLAGLHETTELGHGLPLLLLALCAATGATTATASTATVTAALSATMGSKSTSVGHFDVFLGCPGGLVVGRWWSSQQRKFKIAFRQAQLLKFASGASSTILPSTVWMRQVWDRQRFDPNPSNTRVTKCSECIASSLYWNGCMWADRSASVCWIIIAGLCASLLHARLDTKSPDG